MPRIGIVYALLSALAFGVSAPAAKLLLGRGLDPFILAGLLYLGSGCGLAVLWAFRRRSSEEAPLRVGDIPRLLLITMFGGVLGPLLLMLGLAATPAGTAALLLNTEAVATMLIAWLIYREATDARLVAGALAILGGAVLLAWSGPGGFSPGALAVIGACIAWGIDNNLTRQLASRDPLQIAAVKGAVAGPVNLAIGMLAGHLVPASSDLAIALALGFVSYGVSLVLFILALRHVGTARTGAYFATAPFIGAGLAVAFLGEPVTGRFALAAALIGIGVYLHLSEVHEHEHEHDAQFHDHRHVHDAHHQHAHGPEDPRGEPHSHPHRHPRLKHSHRHYPDLHHGHRHAG
ncbi:MAG TPA: EamA family transporter [Bauldia sp.]|nr:EamA family transporter [Bauldia sp.]